MAFSTARRNKNPVGANILDMQVIHKSVQLFPRFGDCFAALQKIRRVKNGPKLRQVLQQIKAARGCIAINRFFVFMAQNNAAAGSRLTKTRKAQQHLVARFFPAVFAAVKTEHTNPLCAAQAGNFDRALHLFQLRRKRLVDPALAARRTDGPHRKAVFPQHGAKAF